MYDSFRYGCQRGEIDMEVVVCLARPFVFFACLEEIGGESVYGDVSIAFEGIEAFVLYLSDLHIFNKA